MGLLVIGFWLDFWVTMTGSKSWGFSQEVEPPH